MNQFTFKNPTKILFGRGQISQLSKEIPNDSRILMVYGGGSIKSNGVYDQVIRALANHEFLEFSGIPANPTYESLMPAVELCREKGVNFVLAVGGGSVIDGCKFIASAVSYSGEPWEILSRRGKIQSVIPIGVVLTLPATGSEMNAGAVITLDRKKEKLSFFHEGCYPLFSVLDPEVTKSLPSQQIGNGIVDTFVHVLEQYLTYPVNAKIQDRFSEGILLTLIEDGLKALDRPKALDYRANLMWSSTMALNGLIGAGVPQDWTTHIIGHELTAKFGVSHAESLSMLYTHGLRERLTQKREKLLQYGQRVWQIDRNLDENEQLKSAIEKTEKFFQSVGLRTSLQEINPTDEDIQDILERLDQRRMNHLGEHRDVDLGVIERILNRSRKSV